MIKKALVLSTLSLSFVSFAAMAQNVAVVNGKAIPSSYSDEAVKEVVKQGGKDTPELRNNIKTQLIVGEVLLQEAEKQNLASTDNVKKQMEMARRSILIDALRNDYVKKNPVSDNEVKAEYDRLVKMQKGQTEYHVKHILVKDKATADSIIKQLGKKGSSFEKLAQEKSLDKQSAARGGDMGWATPGDLVKPFADAMVSLKKGQISQTPVQTEFGYHVIKVVDSQKVKIPTFEQIKPKLKASMQYRKWQEYEMSLMKQAKIQ